MKLSRWIPAATFFLALPAGAYAGHVESGILRYGTPTRWWKDNKTRVMDRIKALETRIPVQASQALWDRLAVGPGAGRYLYIQALATMILQAPFSDQQAVWGNEKTWKSDVAVVQRRLNEVLRVLPRETTLPTKTYVSRVHEALAGEANRQKRIAAFAAQDHVQEGLLANLERMNRVMDDRFAVEKEIADLVLIAQFLRPDNKGFFLNGYSNTALNPSPSYASLYPNFSWEPKAVEAARNQTVEILAEIGPAAVPIMQRALDDYKTQTRNGGNSVKLPSQSLAVATQWSTKDVYFPVAVHPMFQKNMEELIRKATGESAAKKPVVEDVASVDRVPAKSAPEVVPAPVVVPPPAAPDPVAQAVARRRDELLEYSGVRGVEARDGAIRIEVATPADADDLRILLGDETLGFRIKIIVSS